MLLCLTLEYWHNIKADPNLPYLQFIIYKKPRIKNDSKLSPKAGNIVSAYFTEPKYIQSQSQKYTFW